LAILDEKLSTQDQISQNEFYPTLEEQTLKLEASGPKRLAENSQKDGWITYY
jgi:hypothetical protein